MSKFLRDFILCMGCYFMAAAYGSIYLLLEYTQTVLLGTEINFGYFFAISGIVTILFVGFSGIIAKRLWRAQGCCFWSCVVCFRFIFVNFNYDCRLNLLSSFNFYWFWMELLLFSVPNIQFKPSYKGRGKGEIYKFDFCLCCSRNGQIVSLVRCFIRVSSFEECISNSYSIFNH